MLRAVDITKIASKEFPQVVVMQGPPLSFLLAVVAIEGCAVMEPGHLRSIIKGSLDHLMPEWEDQMMVEFLFFRPLCVLKIQ